MTSRRKVVLAIGASAFSVLPVSRAQKLNPGIPHIAYLSQGSQADRGVFLSAFREGLRDFGWIDGANIAIEVYWAPVHDFPRVAASAVERNPAAIVGTCIASTRAAKDASSSIPVVMSVNGDPVTAGLVASLARPGTNVTGASTLFEALVPKWIEIISVLAPGAPPVAVLTNPESVDGEYWWHQIQQVAKRSGVSLVRVNATSASGLHSAFAEMREQRVGAVITMVDAFFLNELQRLVELTNEHRLPAMYGFREYAEAGGLVSYGLSYRDYFRLVASYVDKILRGAKPADLPVEQPKKIEFVINLRTAKAIGVLVPQPLLLRADEVIP